ncbi:MAG: YIP1 family protein [Tannerellaceae bacterium]|nr:YIP1 family protein [Tannerellaceae bacterium]
MFSDIFSWVIQLITQPGKAWRKLADKEETEEQFLSRFIYPLIGLVTIAAFVGILATRKQFDSEVALKSAIVALVSAFGGFFLSAWSLNEIGHALLGRAKNMKQWQRFVGYSSVLMFSLEIVLSLLPEFFFLRIFLLYTFYIMWEGAGPFMQVEEKERLKFVSVSTAVVLLMPAVINYLMVVFMPGLRV